MHIDLGLRTLDGRSDNSHLRPKPRARPGFAFQDSNAAQTRRLADGSMSWQNVIDRRSASTWQIRHPRRRTRTWWETTTDKGCAHCTLWCGAAFSTNTHQPRTDLSTAKGEKRTTTTRACQTKALDAPHGEGLAERWGNTRLTRGTRTRRGRAESQSGTRLNSRSEPRAHGAQPLKSRGARREPERTQSSTTASHERTASAVRWPTGSGF